MNPAICEMVARIAYDGSRTRPLPRIFHSQIINKCWRLLVRSMNVFQTHSSIISDYATYIRNFLKIDDPDIRKVVEGELGKGRLWPEPLLQFNPSFQMWGETFSSPDKLDKLAKRDFIVTSGTGSGKLRTYIGTIFHHLLSNPNPDAAGVTAVVVVYPMNALCIGASTTAVSVGSLAEQRAEVAKVATTLFGKSFTPEQIVNESLDRSFVSTASFLRHKRQEVAQ